MIKIFEDIKNIDKTTLFNRSLSASGVEDIVSDIIANVRKRGDEALFEYTERFDRAKLSSLEVSKEEIHKNQKEKEDFLCKQCCSQKIRMLTSVVFLPVTL